jgi:hypothetical protein
VLVLSCWPLPTLPAQGVVILQAKANKIDKQIAATEKEAGGNREELEQTLRRVSTFF